MKIESIDIFCEVIDNYGDVGVAYRLARELREYYSEKKIRLFIDRVEELNKIIDKKEKLEVIKYSEIPDNIKVADLIFECFGCNIPKIYMDKAYYNSKILLNLEYFSSEDWIEDFHLQESILPKGSLKKYFFMPGITQKSGGLIIDSDFLRRKENVKENREKYLKKFSINNSYDLIGSIFSYEKNFEKLLTDLNKLNKKILLFILGEKTQKNFDNINKYDRIKIVKLPFYSYDKYEELISLCDFNFVRGEDSFARVLILGMPFLWHIYPQSGETHIIKLKSFLEKYYGDWQELKEVFLNYNLDKDNYEYFFENFDKIKERNEIRSQYLLKNCNLVNKLNNFIGNLGGSK